MILSAAAERAHSLSPSEPFVPSASGPERVYLAPGRLYVSSADAQVTTILGSCVAVCLWDPQARVGGVNHFLLPSGRPASPRFGDAAMAELIDLLATQAAVALYCTAHHAKVALEIGRRW